MILKDEYEDNKECNNSTLQPKLKNKVSGEKYIKRTNKISY